MIHLNPLFRGENVPFGVRLAWVFYPECYSAVSVKDFINERDKVKPTGTIILPTAYHNGEIIVQFKGELDLSYSHRDYFLSDSEDAFKLFDLAKNAPLSLKHRMLAERAKVSQVTLNAPFVFYSQESNTSYLGGWVEEAPKMGGGKRQRREFFPFREAVAVNA